MARLFVRHTGADYAAWRKLCDAFDPQRRPMGVTAHGPTSSWRLCGSASPRPIHID
jgi:hypothetical protein